MPTREEIWAAADLPTRRLAGAALNPSTPVDLLLRLLAHGPRAVQMVLCRDRVLPEAVVDAVIRHPDPRVRADFARNRFVTPAERARLVDDPEWLVRTLLAGGPSGMHYEELPPLPDETIVHMMSTYDGDSLDGFFSWQISLELRRRLPTHPVAKARVWGVGRWSSLPAETRAALLADPADDVRERAENAARHEDPAWVESTLPERSCHARTGMLLYDALSRKVVDSVLTAPAREDERATLAANPTLPPDVVGMLASDPDPEVRGRIAGRVDLGPAERRSLAADPDPGVRRTVAAREDLGPEERRALAEDPDPKVRLAVSRHPAWAEEELTAIDYEVPLDDDFAFWPEPLTPRDPEAVRRDALSSHPMLRRQAARVHTLPADLVARLAADYDLGVRVLLAQNHPDAPPALLLRSFLEYTGHQRERLAALPRFPTAGLAVHADDEDPAVRALAARDPETPSDVVDRLTRDPDPGVRAAFARHPSLPQARLAELLDDEELVQHAAANPALGVDAIRALVAALPVS
ncbi:hypothetical protein ABZ464_43800 [Streptomyces sp. NPDC005820]|uniref:hypothetical protein n=1 Tax=Streptomyces sp. NPDC005820 TaxID=3157069 RepID=UPI0033C8B063